MRYAIPGRTRYIFSRKVKYTAHIQPTEVSRSNNEIIERRERENNEKETCIVGRVQFCRVLHVLAKCRNLYRCEWEGIRYLIVVVNFRCAMVR